MSGVDPASVIEIVGSGESRFVGSDAASHLIYGDRYLHCLTKPIVAEILVRFFETCIGDPNPVIGPTGVSEDEGWRLSELLAHRVPLRIPNLENALLRSQDWTTQRSLRAATAASRRHRVATDSQSYYSEVTPWLLAVKAARQIDGPTFDNDLVHTSRTCRIALHPDAGVANFESRADISMRVGSRLFPLLHANSSLVKSKIGPWIGGWGSPEAFGMWLFSLGDALRRGDTRNFALARSIRSALAQPADVGANRSLGYLWGLEQLAYRGHRFLGCQAAGGTVITILDPASGQVGVATWPIWAESQSERRARLFWLLDQFRARV